MFYLFLLVAGSFALYVLNPEERARLARRALGIARHTSEAAVRAHSTQHPFYEALRTRTRWPIVTPALLLLYVTVFAGVVAEEGSMSDPRALMAWGASFGPQTTNGEWWRLLTMGFVHEGVVHLIADLAGLAVLGLVLERYVGHLAFATVYLASGIFAALGILAAEPMTVATGSAGAIFGLYGLVAAAAVWNLIARAPFAMPPAAAQPIASGAALFLLYNAVTGGLTGPAAVNGLAMGFFCGLVLTKGLHEYKPPAVRSGAAVAAALVVAIVAAIPLRGFLDVKPEIARVVDVEQRTSSVYDKAVAQFRLGGMNAESLAQVIHARILPELQAVRSRLEGLGRVPEQDRSIVARAAEYVRLRAESWRLRAEGLQNHDMPTLQTADRTEWASLKAFEEITTSKEVAR